MLRWNSPMMVWDSWRWECRGSRNWILLLFPCDGGGLLARILPLRVISIAGVGDQSHILNGHEAKQESLSLFFYFSVPKDEILRLQGPYQTTWCSSGGYKSWWLSGPVDWRPSAGAQIWSFVPTLQLQNQLSYAHASCFPIYVFVIIWHGGEKMFFL